MPSWRTANALLYRAYSWYQERPRRLALDFGPARTDRGAKTLVFLSWGLIGDAVLTTAMFRNFKTAFPEHRILCLGREQVRWVLAPHADEFVAMDPTRADLGAEFVAACRAGSFSCCDVLTGDVHVFYGGLTVLHDFVAQLPAGRKILYEGYANRGQLAPKRRFPAGVTVVPSLAKPALHAEVSSPPCDTWHVWHDQLHFFAHLVTAIRGRSPAQLGVAFATDPCLHVPDSAPVLARLGLAAGTYVACHLVSNNPKKDWPLSSWSELLARSDRSFVILGSAADRARVRGLESSRVRILCGETSLPETAALIRSAAGFLGLDSGLAHIATCVDQKTVVIAQNATLGWFFPYPAGLARKNLTTLWNLDSPECIACFFRCPREPLWELANRGARCMREISVGTVAAALERALAGSGR